MGPTSSLGPRVAGLCSLLVLGLHAVYCASYGYEARQYLTQAQVNETMQTYVYRLLGLGAAAHRNLSFTLGVTSGLLGAWHALGVARAVRASVRFRRLLLDVPDERILQRLKTKIAGSRQKTYEPTQPNTLTWCTRVTTRLGAFVREYMMMDGAHFETGTNVRKSIEIFTQYALLDRMSRTISEKKINDLAVAVFVLNCWSTPLIRWWFRHNPDKLRGRLYRHVVTMLLASCFTVAIPTAIWIYVMPLIEVKALRFDQVATTRVRLLVRHVIVSQWTQVISTRLAACLAILAIETVKKKLKASTFRHDVASVAVAADETSVQTPDQPVNSSSLHSTPGTQSCCRGFRASIVIDLLWFITGIAAMSLHTSAGTIACPPKGIKCDMLLHPWAATKFPCAILEINCFRGEIQGTSSEIDDMLSSVDESIVSALRFTHCPALDLPPRLQNLSDLALMEIYNSSVSRWEAHAALTTRRHPFLGSLWLIRVSNIPSLPQGLLDTNFPAADVVLSRTDVASLPSDLAERWPRQFSKLVVEHSKLTIFPDAFFAMSGLAMSLAGNDIEFIPSGALQGKYFAYLSLAENPRLNRVPDIGYATSSMDVRKTNISAAPLWMTTDGAKLSGSYAYQARQYILQIQIDPDLQNYIYRFLGLGTSLHLGISYTLAVTSSLIAFWHAVGIFRALRASIRFRRLLLDVPDEKIIHKITSKLKSTKKIPLEGRESARNDAGSPANASCTTRWTNKIKTKAAKIHHDYFLMDGVHFEAGANFRKSIEIVTQVSVLYRMSRNMWQLLLNDLVMAAFVLNCWCTPMIRWYFRHNKDPLPSRLYRHIMTIILASVFTVVVPNTAWLYVMSLLVMDSLFDTTVTTQARFFCRHVMITEWRQVFSTRLAAVMAIIGIETLKSKVQITRREFSSVVTHGYAVASTATATPVTTSTSPSRGWKARLRSVLYAHLLVDVAWLAVGGTVLGIHITARRLPTLAPGLRCHLPMHNWLTSKYTCAVLEVSCYRGKIAGRADELNALLKSVDPLVTSAIRFTHCPSLTMPKRIQTFSDLASIEVYNSSITHWGSEAALTSSKHPFLGSLCLARVTNIASLPVGLLDLNFPACDILISATDLSSLPSDLPDLWSRTMARIVIENSNFTVFPDALLQINSLAMSFSGNDLVSVPAGALEGRMFGSLSLANNQRLAEIPPLGWVAGILDLRKTNLSSPPQWATQTMGNLNTGGGLFTLPEIGSIFGGGAPMCSSYAPDARVQLASGMVLDCSLAPFGNPTTDMFPLEHIAQQRQP